MGCRRLCRALENEGREEDNTPGTTLMPIIIQSSKAPTNKLESLAQWCIVQSSAVALRKRQRTLSICFSSRFSSHLAFASSGILQLFLWMRDSAWKVHVKQYDSAHGGFEDDAWREGLQHVGLSARRMEATCCCDSNFADANQDCPSP